MRERSPLTESETTEIIEKHFARVPSLVSILYRSHGFGDMRVLDVGCGFGQSLLYWGEESEGVEIGERQHRFLSALGRRVTGLNVEDGTAGLQPESFDAVFTNNLLEHLVAPHLYLARLHQLLKPSGILAVGHPVVPATPWKQFWMLQGYNYWLAVEHINFYTPQTARLSLERAGFNVERQYFPRAGSINPLLGRLTAPIGVHVLSVCRKVNDFKYHPKRVPDFDPEWAEDLQAFH